MASTKSILIVDDEPRMRRFVRMNLELEGFNVSEASDGLEAVRKVREEAPNLVVLDVEMPHLDGFETLAQIRSTSSAPVIMLTVRGEEEERIKGLDLGADDYVTKPFSTAELIARLGVIQRRRAASSEPVVEVGPLSLDLLHQEARMGGEMLRLTPTEFALLRHLGENLGRILTLNQIHRAVWPAQHNDPGPALRVHINHLRQKLAPAFRIENEPGIGYRLMIADEPE